MDIRLFLLQFNKRVVGNGIVYIKFSAQFDVLCSVMKTLPG